MTLAEYKENKGLTYRRIAEMFNVTERTAINWVKGEATISGNKGSLIVTTNRHITQVAA